MGTENGARSGTPPRHSGRAIVLVHQAACADEKIRFSTYPGLIGVNLPTVWNQFPHAGFIVQEKITVFAEGAVELPKDEGFKCFRRCGHSVLFLPYPKSRVLYSACDRGDHFSCASRSTFSGPTVRDLFSHLAQCLTRDYRDDDRLRVSFDV